jgi:hypothetical protein
MLFISHITNDMQFISCYSLLNALLSCKVRLYLSEVLGLSEKVLLKLVGVYPTALAASGSFHENLWYGMSYCGELMFHLAEANF